MSRQELFNDRVFVFLYFAEKQTGPGFTDEEMPFFNDPPLALFPPSYYETTKVFGPLIPESSFSDQGSQPVEVEMVDLFEYYQEQFFKGRDGKDGIFSIGYTDPDDHKRNKKGFGKEYWGEYRITDGNADIVSNEYEIGSVFGRMGNILFENTSNPFIPCRHAYHRAALREGRYLLDRIFHWTPYTDVRQYNLEEMLPRGMPHHHCTSVHFEGYDSGHCTGIPILDWYYSNTGDPDALDMITSFADAICLSEAEKFKSIDQYQTGGLERHLGWPLYTLVQAYLATGDPYYILNAETIVERAYSFLIEVVCPDTSTQKCYGRLLKELVWNSIEDKMEFRFVALGGETFTTAILHHAVAKYSETTDDDSADYQLDAISKFLECLHHEVYDDPQLDKFYKDSRGAEDGVVLELLLASPGILYTGIKIGDTELEGFGRGLIGDFNDWIEDDDGDDQRPLPTAELKQQGQMTNFVLDFMKYYEEEVE